MLSVAGEIAGAALMVRVGVMLVLTLRWMSGGGSPFDPNPEIDK